MTARIVLLVTSPRLPAGLLTAPAWDLLRSAPVFTATDDDQTMAVRAQGVAVTVVPPQSAVDALLTAAAGTDAVVWLAGPGGDESIGRSLGLRLAREPGLAELELMYGSWDPPGARVLDVVTVMDRLASPGGDPWKREQTHRTLAKYLLEEAYEAYDSIVADDLDALREELGDVLLQVVLHARMAEEAEHPWSIDDLAGDLVAKLIRRNPHVFAGEAVADIDEITQNWEQIKRAEKARESAMDGLALSQPALALATKAMLRAARADLPLPPPAAQAPADAEDLGERLFTQVATAYAAQLDAEAALRERTLRYIAAARAAERSRRGESGREDPD
ncbi:nucleoside triphosphate pyrophosphohydrolase [Luedemannella flava]|uniref:Nucleoside triphosphate pyrophosphohydrolase n=1 Tax=Luedemannella flava TaxID=349316 RepID=A0ABP4YZT0_9ACTN